MKTPIVLGLAVVASLAVAETRPPGPYTFKVRVCLGDVQGYDTLTREQFEALSCATPIAGTVVTVGDAEGVVEGTSDGRGLVTVEGVKRWPHRLEVHGKGHSSFAHSGFDTTAAPHPVTYLKITEEVSVCARIPPKRGTTRTATVMVLIGGLVVVLFGLRLLQRRWS